MSFRDRFNIESRGMLMSLVFYAVVGAVLVALLPFAGFPAHVGIIGIFSIVTAYGIFKRRNWAIWFAIILFFVVTAFSSYMLYYYLLNQNYLLSTSMVTYLVLTWVFTAYTLDKRKSLER